MISVLIPVYNAEQYIFDTLESMRKQSYDNLELLICDDASTDSSYTVIEYYMKTYPRMNIKLFRNKVNQGYLKTSNFFVEHSSGDYISFQDADDYSALNRFQLLLDYLLDNNLDLVGSYCGVFQESNEVLSSIRYCINNEEIYKHLIEKPHPPFCGSSILVKAEVVSKSGLYDENFNRISSEDFDWIYRVALNNFKMGNIPETLYFYRQHQSGVSKTNHIKNLLALFSEDIAKELYLSRLAGGNNDFDFYKEKYLKLYNDDSQVLLYKNLNVSLFGSKREILHNFKDFVLKTKLNKNKIKMIILTLLVLLVGYSFTEKIKNAIRVV